MARSLHGRPRRARERRTALVIFGNEAPTNGDPQLAGDGSCAVVATKVVLREEAVSAWQQRVYAARVDDPLACADSETPSQRRCRVTAGTITCTTTTQCAVLPMVRPRSGDEVRPFVKGAAVCAWTAAGASLKEYRKVEWLIEPTEHDHRCCARRSSTTRAHGRNRRSPYIISRSTGRSGVWRRERM